VRGAQAPPEKPCFAGDACSIMAAECPLFLPPTLSHFWGPIFACPRNSGVRCYGRLGSERLLPTKSARAGRDEINSLFCLQQREQDI
jgi:hypothetical protein